MSTDPPPPSPARSGGVQSVERAFDLLETLLRRGGALGLSQLAAEIGLPPPTIHRLVRTLVQLGYVRQDPSRRYVLGPRLIPLGEGASSALGVWAVPHLSTLVEETGESANLAMLDGDHIVYLAQAPSRHAMRMFTEVGRRALPHCTAVGKAVLAHLSPPEVDALLRRTGMPRYTSSTLTNPAAFGAQLRQVAERGYAMDEGEQEPGVRCVAVPLLGAPSRLAVSVSGPATRMSEATVARAVPALQAAASALVAELA